MKNKRIFGFTALLLFTATSVFAQLNEGIKLGAFGRGVFAPLIIYSDAKDGSGNTIKDQTYHMGNTYAAAGSYRPNFGFEQELYLTGDLEYIGFQLGLTFDGEAIRGSVTSSKYEYNHLGAAIWAKPFGNDLLTVTGGTFIEDTLRGKIGEVNDRFEEFVLPGAGFKDEIFTGFGDYGNQNLGFMLSSKPDIVPGLFVGARVNAHGLWADAGSATRAIDAYRYIQVGAGYEVPGIGFARLQYLGGYMFNDKNKRLQKYIDDAGIDIADPSDPVIPVGSIPRELLPSSRHGGPARIEAAFAFTMIENILVDIGAKFYFPVTSDGTLRFPSADVPVSYAESSKGFALSAGIESTFDDLRVNGRIDSAFGAYDRDSKDDKSTDPNNQNTLDIRLVPSYNLGFAEVGLDFAYNMQFNYKDRNGDARSPSQAISRWGLGAFVCKRLVNEGSHIKAGVTYTAPPSYANKNRKNRTSEKMIQIPIIMQYEF